MTANEEEDYTEESYYEEEIIEEEYVEDDQVVSDEALVPPPPPAPSAASTLPARPPHPLFAAGGAKSALAAAAAEMEKKHKAAPIEERQQHDEPQQTAAPPSRPVHPLFGGGGGGGGNKSALNDQIKMMAAKRNDRVAKEGIPEPPAPAAKKKSIDAVMPPNASKFGGNTQTASLADQVAMLAARRRERMEQQGGAEPNPCPTNSMGSPAQKPTVIAKPTKVTSSMHSSTTSKAAPEKKKGVFGFGKKEPEPKKQSNAPTAPAAPVQVKVKTPVQTIPPPEPAKPPAFTKAVLRKTETPVENRSVANPTAPSFANAKLRQTGLLDASAPVQEEQETAPLPPSAAASAPQSSGPVQVGETITTRKITKKDPEYEIVEYKVGCVCTIL